MIAKFGRKLRMIGRPPGRPTRTKNTNISLTCTICEAPVQTVSEGGEVVPSSWSRVVVLLLKEVINACSSRDKGGNKCL